MRKLRFYYAGSLNPHAIISLDKKSSHHITHVLRLKAGDNIEVFNNEHHYANALISEISRSKVSVTIHDIFQADPPSPINVHIGQIIAKGQAMDLVVQKTTELGVAEITPLMGKRTMYKVDKNKQDSKHEHWESISISACAQSHRNDIPTINKITPVHEWLSQKFPEDTVKYVLHPGTPGDKSSWPNVPNKKVAILIGPEGGLSDEEVELAKHYGFEHVYLGPRVLRVETAAISALAILQNLHGDLHV